MAQEELVAILRAELSQFRQGMEEAARVVHDTTTRIKREAEESSRGFETMEKGITLAKQALAGFGLTIGLGALVKLGKDAVDAAIKLESLTTSLKALTGGVAGAQASLEFLRATTTRLGLDLGAVQQGFVALTAAARGTALEGGAAQQVFTDVSGAARAMGLSAQQTSGVFTALQQILSKGKVQTQEVVLQLGNDLPGSLQIAARAMGVTTQAFTKMLEDGIIPAAEFVQKLGGQLRKELGAGAEDAARQAQAAFARLGNETLVLSQSVGKSLLTLLQPLAEWTTAALAAINKVSAAREAEAARLRSANPAAFGVLPPSSLATDVGPDRARQAETLRAAIVTQQEQLQQLLGQREAAKVAVEQAGANPFFSGSFAAPTTLVADLAAVSGRVKEQEDRVKALTTAYQGLLKEQANIEKVQTSAAFPADTALLPKAEDVEKFRGVMKQLAEEIKQQELGLKLFGGALPDDQEAKLSAQFDRAQARLTALTKTADDLAQAFVRSPGFLETLQPEQLKMLEKFQGDLVAARARVEELTAAREAFKAQEQATTAAAREAAAEEARLAEGRVDLLRKATKAEQELAEAQVSAAFEDIKNTATANAAHQEFEDAREAAGKRLEQVEARAVSQFEGRRERLRQQVQEYQTAFGATEQSAKALADGLARIDIDETKHNAAELKKQNKDYEEFAKGVTRTLSDQLFAILSGKIASFKDLLGSIKDVFLRVLADMVAAAAVSGLFGTTGGFLGALTGGATAATGAGSGAGATGGGGSSVLGSAYQAAGYGKQLYQLYGSIFGSGASSVAASSLAATTAAENAAALQSGVTGVGASGAAGLSGYGLGAGVTLGAAATSASLGVGTGLAASKLLSLAGLHGTANTTLSGAAGGAVAGATIGSAYPVVGTIVGAVVGAIAGLLVGILGKSPPPPGFTAVSSQGSVPQFGLDAAGLATSIGEGFRPPVSGRQLKPEGLQTIQNALHDVTQEVITPVVETLRQFPKALQEQAVGHLNNLSETLRTTIGTIKFEGDDFAEKFKAFLEKDLPEKVKATFDPFVAFLNQLAPVFKTAQSLLDALKQQEATILGSIAGVRGQLRESGLPASVLFEQRNAQLQDLLSSYRADVPEQQRVVLGQQITGLVQSLGQSAGQIFSTAGDQEGLAAFKQGLEGALNIVEQDTRNVFEAAKTATQTQIDLLTSSLSSQQSMEDLLAGVNSRLDQIAQLLAPVGSFQTEPGQVRYVPRTGLALVHQGELVGRPMGSGSISITINAGAGSDAQTIGRTTATAVRNTIRQLQQSSRYRQGGL